MVAPMPASGHIAAKSREKYGLRDDGRQEARRQVMEAVRLCKGERLTVASDAHRSYPRIIRAASPSAKRPPRSTDSSSGGRSSRSRRRLGGRLGLLLGLRRRFPDPVRRLHHPLPVLIVKAGTYKS